MDEKKPTLEFPNRLKWIHPLVHTPAGFGRNTTYPKPKPIIRHHTITVYYYTYPTLPATRCNTRPFNLPGITYGPPSTRLKSGASPSPPATPLPRGWNPNLATPKSPGTAGWVRNIGNFKGWFEGSPNNGDPVMVSFPYTIPMRSIWFWHRHFTDTPFHWV